ncbi:MAG: hypothetical protein ACYC4S_00520 [Rhodoferax sp.]
MNCCDASGVCTLGPDCPCGDAPTATVADPAGIPTRPLGDALDLSPYAGPQMVVLWVCILAFGIANLLVIFGALGYLWDNFGAQLRDLFWALMARTF